jgi:hypothetical protein
MKTIKFLTIGVLFFFLSKNTTAQNLTYSPAEGLYTGAQKELLLKAEKWIESGNKKLRDAEAIESKYDKPEKKKKKKKEKKIDKKTWEAKKLKIQAEKDFLKAYQDASAVYSEIIVGFEYYDDGDDTKANKLNNEATETIESSEKKMEEYNKMVGDKKSLQKLSSSSLNSAINSANSLKESALKKQTDAIDIVLNQENKKIADREDNEAWAIAESENTIESYQEYINNFPKGKFVDRARTMIKKLSAEKEKSNDPVVQSDFIFMVQIAASKTELPQNELSIKYKNVSEIETVRSGKYFKYRVGNFSRYSDAAALRDKLIKTTVNDAFVVVYDKNGKQIVVSNQMKQ